MQVERKKMAPLGRWKGIVKADIANFALGVSWNQREALGDQRCIITYVRDVMSSGTKIDGRKLPACLQSKSK